MKKIIKYLLAAMLLGAAAAPLQTASASWWPWDWGGGPWNTWGGPWGGYPYYGGPWGGYPYYGYPYYGYPGYVYPGYAYGVPGWGYPYVAPNTAPRVSPGTDD